MNRIVTILIGIILFSASSVKVKAQSGCSCWQQRDTSFHYVPFAWDSDGSYIPNPPYYRCDDGATLAIHLPFNFCFWGTAMDSVFINTNGNISFYQHIYAFSPDTFPVSDYRMIAPFWGDVDLRRSPSAGTDVVLYKITSHYMIVQWDSVRFFDATVEPFGKYNSFQLIISDGTDPILPKGNNVEFCYHTMQWTTGDASGGSKGFGGDPATVGANYGDGTKFIQMGLFDTAGNKYLGQFPPGPSYDGVSWLNNRSFLFNLCSGSIAPLTSGISPCDTFKICVGDSMLIPLYFFSPVQNDSVWSNLSPPVPPGVSVYSSKPGHTDSLTIKVVGNSFNLGYHTINVYAYDNEHPPDTTYTSFVIEIDSLPKVKVKAVMDTICAGDTSVLTASGSQLYLWSTGATTSIIKVSPPSTQTYTVGASNGGCNHDTTIQVVVLPNPAPTIIAKPDTICPKDSVLLIAGGGGTYKWSTGQTKDSIWVNPLTTKVYYLTATNGKCSDSAKISIFVTTPGASTIALNKDSICPYDTVILTASGGVKYKWSNGATTSSITVTPGSTTTYTVYSNVTCAIDTLKQKVIVIPLPVATITGRTAVCKGQGDTITVSGGISYQWSNGSTKSQYILKNIGADSTISVRLFNGKCYVDTTIKITIASPPIISVIAPAVACSGTMVVIKSSVSGSGPFKYLWKPGNQTTDSIVVDDTSKVTYTLEVSNGCISTTKTTITPDNPPLKACCDKVIILGDDTVITASGSTIIKYQWIDSNLVICQNPPLCSEVKVTPTVTTTYTVIGTDTLGCQKEMVITIIVEVPCFNITVPNVITPNFGAGHVGVNGGTNNVFYIQTQNMDGWSVLIYDRWGKEMFKTTNPNTYWNCTTEGGAEAPDGVYYYIITGSCQGKTYNQHGFVQVIR